MTFFLLFSLSPSLWLLLLWYRLDISILLHMSNLICSLYFLLLLIQCDLVTSKLKAGLTLIQVVDEVSGLENQTETNEDGKGR